MLQPSFAKTKQSSNPLQVGRHGGKSWGGGQGGILKIVLFPAVEQGG